MTMKDILDKAFARGVYDKGHPGPDAADIADLVEKAIAEGVIPDINKPEVTDNWTDEDWEGYRLLHKNLWNQVGEAYAEGQRF